MPFGIGGSDSRTESNSSSSSFDNLDSTGFNIGASGSESGGRSRSGSSQNIAFEDVFARLFGGASATAGGIDTSSLTRASNMLFGSGASFLDSLGGGGAGAGFIEDRLAGSDSRVSDEMGILEADLNRFVGEQADRRTTSSGVAAGTLGGGRTLVQNQLTDRNAAEAFARGSVDIRAREREATDALALGLAQDETMRAGTGLDSLAGLQGISESGALAGLTPFAALSQILGGPVALTESFGEADDFASSFARDFGFDSTVGRAGSQSESSSRGRSRSFNFGFE